MAAFMNEQIAQQVRDVLSGLEHPVEILFFGKEKECEYCPETRQLLEEVTALSEKVSLSVYDIDQDAASAEQYHVDKVPGFVLARRQGEKTIDYGVRYAGIPSGHEFTSLINDLILISRGDSGLQPATREYLKGLTQPVLLQVFTTPT